MVAIDSKRADDFELMRRVHAGDEAAVACLYERFAPLVYRIARQTLPRACDVDDVVQEVFVRLWRTADRYDPERASLVTWVMLIARRRTVDAIRRHQRTSEHTLDADSRAGRGNDGVPERDERFSRVMNRLEVLTDLQRTVVTRVYLRGHPLRQIGKDLNIPLGTIKTALFRSMNMLRAEFARPSPSPEPAMG